MLGERISFDKLVAADFVTANSNRHDNHPNFIILLFISPDASLMWLLMALCPYWARLVFPITLLLSPSDVASANIIVSDLFRI